MCTHVCGVCVDNSEYWPSQYRHQVIGFGKSSGALCVCARVCVLGEAVFLISLS